MNALLIALISVAAFMGSGTPAVDASYFVPGFALQNNSQCVGGTLIGEFNDVQDTGQSIAAKQLATLDCQNFFTGPGQCCSVQYRRATPQAPAIGSHVFQYQIYQGGTVGPSVPPAGTLTSSFQHWAGGSDGGSTQQPQAVTASLVANPNAILRGESSILSWSSTGAATCTGGSFSTGGATSGSVVVGPNQTTVYSVSCSAPGSTVTTPPTSAAHTEGDMFVPNNPVRQDMMANGGVAFTETTFVGRTLQADQTTMNRVCKVLHGDGSTASNIGARGYSSCGNNQNIAFNGSIWQVVSGCTGAHISGSFTCTVPGTTSSTPGQSANASATVSVSEPNEEPEFSVSCRAHPTTAGKNEDVLWSSTVTGGEGTYTYEWTGTNNLVGSTNQVVKKYSTTGNKTASLTVTYVPNSATPPPPPPPPPQNQPTPPATPTPTPPQNPPLTPTVPPAAICPALGWITPVTPCSGIWAPTYDTGGCQSGWQCTQLPAISGGGGGILPPENQNPILERNFLEDIFLNLFTTPVFAASQHDSQFTDSIDSLAEVNSAAVSCTPAYNSNQWYSGTEVLLAYEGTLTPISCESYAIDAGYQYWNRAVTNTCPSGGVGSLPCNYDPAQTVCYGIANPGSLISKPQTGSATTYPTYFDSGTTCSGAPQGTSPTNKCELTITPSTVQSGQSAVLSWSVNGYSQLTIDNGVGGVTPVASGSKVITPSTSATYTGTASNPATQTTSPPSSASHTEGDMFVPNNPVRQDMMANGGVAFTETTFVGRTLQADQTTMNRVCKVLHGDGSTASNIGARGYSSCGNNQNIAFNGSIWQVVSGCTGAHISGSFTCSVPGVTTTNPGSSVQCTAATVSVVQPQVEPQVITVQCDNSVTITDNPPQCSDGVDNDGNGHADHPEDPNCTNPDDDDESDDDYPQCSDGRDNDGDQRIDYGQGRDPGCSSPQDDDESNDDGEEEEEDPPAQCADGIDNDNDGRVDAADSGCINGGTPGGNPGTYNPNDNSEGGGSNQPPGSQCSDGIDNNGDGNVDFPEDPGCSGSGDNSEQGESGQLTLKATPPLIKKGQQCTIALSATNVTSCTLSGPGVSRGFTAQNGIVNASTVVTPELIQTSTYTLTCNGTDGKKATKTVDCKIAPTFEEF